MIVKINTTDAWDWQCTDPNLNEVARSAVKAMCDCISNGRISRATTKDEDCLFHLMEKHTFLSQIRLQDQDGYIHSPLSLMANLFGSRFEFQPVIDKQSFNAALNADNDFTQYLDRFMSNGGNLNETISPPSDMGYGAKSISILAYYALTNPEFSSAVIAMMLGKGVSPISTEEFDLVKKCLEKNGCTEKHIERYRKIFFEYNQVEGTFPFYTNGQIAPLNSATADVEHS